MSTSTLPVDPDSIAAKAAELKKQFQGRELLTIRDILALFGISRMSVYWLTKRGAFIPETRIGLRTVFYSVGDTAAFLLGHAHRSVPTASATPVKQVSPADASKLGRPRKQRIAVGNHAQKHCRSHFVCTGDMDRQKVTTDADNVEKAIKQAKSNSMI